ncbi:TlyA family RNA methyltransferase [Emergencia timonensis]|uniref:TlyA family RNA methyltransferase n=1 Tax=Emergencia timonensis TaxID=1776384 RepID=UPI00241F48BE|nr:TlyA family RNA methyltransferase [Emergencia timonensis]
MKQRLDVALVERGLIASREKAKVVIMEGLVYVNGQKSDKAGAQIKDDDKIEIRGETMRYVSRGGKKLEKAMQVFPISLDGCVCIDIGASTGGFTDCMLQNGAVKVYAIDVGYGQLDWKLRTDDRVVNMEKCNVRYLDTDLIAEPIDFISIDVSFISLKLIFPVAAKVLAEDGEIVCLVKPQFEAGREQVGKKGIVRDRKVHEEVIQNVIEYARENGLYPQGLTFSPVTGAKGNIEYLLALSKMEKMSYNVCCIQEIVANSHAELE